MTSTLNTAKGRPRSGASHVKAVPARAYGGPEVLTLEDVDRPKPEANQVLAEVHAAATNLRIHVPAEMLAAGQVTPAVGERYTLAETADAISDLEGGRAVGKSVVAVGGAHNDS